MQLEDVMVLLLLFLFSITACSLSTSLLRHVDQSRPRLGIGNSFDPILVLFWKKEFLRNIFHLRRIYDTNCSGVSVGGSRTCGME